VQRGAERRNKGGRNGRRAQRNIGKVQKKHELASLTSSKSGISRRKSVVKSGDGSKRERRNNKKGDE